jgi:hemin uptake protein HemP
MPQTALPLSPEMPAPCQPQAQAARPVPRHDARILTEGGPFATIGLDGQDYVLRIMRGGKLILTK